MEPRICMDPDCNQRIDGACVRCSACKAAYYCNVDHQRKHWPLHEPVCSKISEANKSKSTSNALETQEAGQPSSSHRVSAVHRPTHNLMDAEIHQEKETAMIEEYYKWRKIWYPTIVKCVFSMLSCEPYGTDKLRSHGLAIWVGERAEYNQLDTYQADLRDRAERNKWTKWNPEWWNEATAFTIGYVRLVPWEHLSEMLECFPLDQSFLNSFRTLCPPNKLRIVAFVAPSFLSYDYEGMSRSSLSSRYPPPRWTFPPDSQIKPEVKDLITRTMPFFEPLVTNYSTSGVTDPEDKTRYSHFNSDAWEFLIKKVVDQGWYSDDARLWRQLIDKLACQDCRGREPVPAEVRSGLAYMSKVDYSAKRNHSC